jgi:hypothetical protein
VHVKIFNQIEAILPSAFELFFKPTTKVAFRLTFGLKIAANPRIVFFLNSFRGRNAEKENNIPAETGYLLNNKFRESRHL